jgi:hypothetical protein
MSVKPFSTEVLQGIPFLVDPNTKSIFAFEKPVSNNPLRLGTYDPTSKTFELLENWKELYQARLETHRATERPRTRLNTTQSNR